MSIEEEAAYHFGMNPDRTYISRAFQDGEFGERLLRFVSKVVDCDNNHVCDVDGNELVIRQTAGERQQIKALFYEDDRNIKTLIFQRFGHPTGNPYKKSAISFTGEHIETIRWLLEVVTHAELDQPGKLKFADRYLNEVLAEDNHLLEFLQQNRDRLAQLRDAKGLSEYLEFSERRRQLSVFESLLNDQQFFEQTASEWGVKGTEAVWQRFFEQNRWIFGLSLAPIFLSSFDGWKLEQVVRGFSVAGEGKRADALMRTNGYLSSLCFVEIKTHSTPLVQTQPYRSGAWSVSGEVAGAVAQCHATVESAMRAIDTRLAPVDDFGDPTGEESFLYQPRSYLVVGQLSEFVSSSGTNVPKYRSFELFRRHLRAPEVITFDELYERAKAIVELSGPSA